MKHCATSARLVIPGSNSCQPSNIHTNTQVQAFKYVYKYISLYTWLIRSSLSRGKEMFVQGTESSQNGTQWSSVAFGGS